MKRKAIKEIKSAKARNAEHARRWRMHIKDLTKSKNKEILANTIIDKRHEERQIFEEGHTHLCIVDECGAEYDCSNACEQTGGTYAPCPKCFTAAVEAPPMRRMMDRRGEEDSNHSRKIL